MMESTSNTRKRPKQACRNCRRKKARCPGERPACSFCMRLKQQCDYDEPTAPRKAKSHASQAKTARLAERVADLESKLQSLNSTKDDETTRTPTYKPSGFIQSPTFESETQNHSPRQNAFASNEEPLDAESDIPKFHRLPPECVILAAVDAYFLVCHSRPCSFFFRDRFQQELDGGQIPAFLIRAVIASTAHLLLDPWFEDNQTGAIQTMAQLAWREALTESMSETSTDTTAVVQTMGLLILLDIRSSSYSAAVTKLRMAVSIAESSRMNHEPSNELSMLEQEERRYVFWSLYVIDKVSALVLGNAPLLVDLNCTLSLPEEQRSFRKSQQNNMTNLATAKDSFCTRGGFAKLIVACSLVGQLATLSQDDTLYRGRFGGSLLELHKSLSARIRRLGSMLSEEEGSFTVATGVDGRIQIMYARSMFHCVGIFINHPFFVKRYIPANQRSLQVCMRTNQQCREHAQRLGDWLRSANSYDAVPHNQLFPGYGIFNAGLVQCLFMCSPDRAVATKSRQLYEGLKTLLSQQAVSGASSDPNYYIRTLEYFANRPGAAHLLADASSTYVPRSGQPGLWHFLDFSWLDDLFTPNEEFKRDTVEETMKGPAASYETSSAAFPSFDTASSGASKSNTGSTNRRTPQQQSPEPSVQNWDSNKSVTRNTEPLPFGFMPQNTDLQNGTGMPTPSQSPPFSTSDKQQSYGMMDVEPESFAKWVASAYSRWDASPPDPENFNKNQDMRLLYG